MEQGLDLQTFLLVAGFALLIGMSAWHRHHLVVAMRAVPDEVRARLDWEAPEDLRGVRRHRRRISRRLITRGLPDWVPLSPEGRHHLRWHRIFGLAAAFWLPVVPALAWGVWMLLPILGAPAVAVVAFYSWLDGPWGSD